MTQTANHADAATPALPHIRKVFLGTMMPLLDHNEGSPPDSNVGACLIMLAIQDVACRPTRLRLWWWQQARRATEARS